MKPEEFALKEMKPVLGPSGRGGAASDKLTSTHDLVEQMHYLFIRIVKAKDLPPKDLTGSCDPYVEVRIGNYKGTTRHLVKKTDPEWEQVFAFAKERIQVAQIEVVVKDENCLKDGFIGRLVFDLVEVPKRVPPDSPLAPQWYSLEDRKGDKSEGELMLALWMGTQADEAFPEAWHSESESVPSHGLANIRSKVYITPKLWYVRVNVIEAQDLIPTDNSRVPEVYVKVNLGTKTFKTKASTSKSVNPMWNEDFIFVAAEPFEEHLILSVEDSVAPNKEEVLGKVVIPMQSVYRRLDTKAVSSRWYDLEKHGFIESKKKEPEKFFSKIHLRICLEGGYHVLDESTHCCSDMRPTAKQLWKSSIGLLELGILSARGLPTMKKIGGRGTTDAYCVAKYGQKWVRTRTIVDNTNPKWNEQYTWEVFDPYTVLTIGVFDNSHFRGEAGSKDSRIGKVRIRLSTLQTDIIYTHSYPLIVLGRSGVKKMGELQLAVRFTCASLLNMVQMYSQPLLPKMHYAYPLSVLQIDQLRSRATQIIATRLGRAEPPLRKEVVEYLLDVDSYMWSMRKTKVNFFRIMDVLKPFTTAAKWFDQICQWKNPVTTILAHILFLILVILPELIVPTIVLSILATGIWSYRWRPSRHPPHVDTRLSQVDAVNADELDEEFDSFPTSGPSDIVRMRYDRLRTLAGRAQTILGDIAIQGERFQSLLNWRDPRATAIFITFSMMVAIVLLITPSRVVLLLAGFYLLRHPRFRDKVPPAYLNFFRRLPSQADCLI